MLLGLLKNCVTKSTINKNRLYITCGSFKNYSSKQSISLGNITKETTEAERPEYVPIKYYHDDIPKSSLHHLKWILQKDLLNQDIFLLGPPGPRRRHLAMQYLELTNREHEYVALSRDTTESDLKQRREIVKGTANYFDQSAVKAAKEGRILILDGIEKAERNVLPVLNNLLENREMHLEDGRLLIPAARYDKLLKEHGKEELEKWKLVRVDSNFRVIALGLPVPKYRGNPLDPPLRSRFQARYVQNNSYQEYLGVMRNLAPNVAPEKLEKIVSCAFALLTKESATLGLPDFPLDNLLLGAIIMEQNPDLSPYEIIYRLYPYKVFLKDGVEYVENLLAKLGLPASNSYTTENVSTKIPVAPSTEVNSYIETKYQNALLESIIQSLKNADVCIVGTKGCGKSMIVNKVAEIFGQEAENIVLYQDMTSRDLIQQRTTLDNGDTIWKLSPLIEAALEGKIAVLDGINRIHPSTLTVLHRLVQDRELQLYDGKRLISKDRYEVLQKRFNLTKDQLTENGVFQVHPDFRIIAIGEPPNLQSPTGNWMSPEMLSIFLFHEMRTLSKEEETHVITTKFGHPSTSLQKIINLAHILRDNTDPSLKNLSGHLSTRKILKIASRLNKYPTEDVYSLMEETFMIKFLPSLTRQALDKTMEKIGITFIPQEENSKIKCEIKNGILTIGNTTASLYQATNLTKIPDTLFYDVPQHISLMERLLQDFQLGYNLLLVGNQGVGKNKIVDRFLELLNRPREYIQLHRDTTVQTLTIQPTIKNGILVHEDSPLVKAIKYGHVLVIDEADKAPTHVTCILKTLVESGEMILSDGRRIIPNTKTPKESNINNIIVTHPDFRMIVLANRPGFPFLGNDFFGSLGDLFSSHSVDNPSRASEIELLKQYGPNVNVNTIKQLVGIFGELRNMADQGLINYPYSTREVVNIVKHLQKYSNADLEDVLFNVFDFDRDSPDMLETVGEVLHKHGFSKNIVTAEYIAAKRAKEDTTVQRYSGLDAKGPKYGQEDPDNAPHVGGNNWAGGTGGRDTAGLGGKGGPFRLDKGHTVFQLSDQEKSEVPEHITRAAREMGRNALKKKLQEIGMDEYDHSIYSQFSIAVERPVQALRVILNNLQAKNQERQWYRHQTTGELDDVKLIDGILGEKTIFRRRSEQKPELGTPQIKPKLFRVVVDVSGSMYRFNSYDGRLDKELEAVVLVMEAFEGFDDKIKYDIIGHSGEEYNIRFVDIDSPPKNNNDRLKVLRTMYAHSQYCMQGDHTLETTQWAVSNIDEEAYDEAIVIVLSDANLQRYGIPAEDLAKAMTEKPNISAWAVFMGSLGDQAERLTRSLPAGKAFICNDTKELPLILKQIFSSSVVNN